MGSSWAQKEKKGTFCMMVALFLLKVTHQRIPSRRNWLCSCVALEGDFIGGAQEALVVRHEALGLVFALPCCLPGLASGSSKVVKDVAGFEDSKRDAPWHQSSWALPPVIKVLAPTSLRVKGSAV